MADVKWIKITTDIFDDEKILLIESLPEADSMIVIWFKLLYKAAQAIETAEIARSVPVCRHPLVAVEEQTAVEGWF